MEVLRDVRLADSARRTVTIACEEAVYRSQAVSPGHILLAMSRVTGPGSRLVKEMCGDLRAFREGVLAVLPSGTEPVSLPVRWTDRALRVMRRADEIARSAGEAEVNQLHILFAVAAEDSGPAAFLLSVLGFTEHEEARKYASEAYQLSA